MMKTAGRPCSTELDLILGEEFKVLDDGYIRVVDYMGNDQAIVQAARVSYGKGTKKLSEDQGLIRYLMRHRHTTPFEMCEIKFHLRVPMDCWRQWIRHRTANVNEYSTRYSEAIDSCQKTGDNQWRRQSQKNKQGSAEFLDLDIGRLLTESESQLHKLSEEVYQERLRQGVAREQARKDLLLSTYTEAYWKIDLHNLLHFLSLRMDAHAQLEIRSYANVIGREIVSRWCPIVWEAFLDYRLDMMALTAPDIAILRAILSENHALAIRLADGREWLRKGENGLKAHRERQELESKLLKLGLKAPWLS